ncbi:MAG TPA: HD domain-containing protein [Chloroflexia bacterium]|nr:HD domain-containing protein [Chloroflexia bacterium]
MKLAPLPPLIKQILADLNAPPRLMTHLTLVHDVACRLLDLLSPEWPGLDFDRKAVLVGAASHDIGKLLVPSELSGPGKKHEEVGPALLISHGLSPEQARFARTHASWYEEGTALEDRLVAFADTIWKGKRDQALEESLTGWLARSSGEKEWLTFLKLDQVALELAGKADERLSWQASFPLPL